MNEPLKLLLRVGLSIAAAFFLVRAFLKSSSWIAVGGLALLLLIMSYALEYTRNRRS